MGKNNMKKPEEKEIIVKRYFCGESVAKLASEYEIGVRQIYHWINKSHEHMGLHFRKPKNKLEGLEIEIMKKDIEIARLKKGYEVKGVGQEKEFVTTFSKNIK